MPSEQAPTQKLVFVCNELGHFRLHREHLARAAMNVGLQPILLAAPFGDATGMIYEYRAFAIERFRFHP